MVILPLVRTVVFVVSALFSLIVMGLAGGALATSAANHVDTYGCEGLAVAAGLFTLISLPILLAIDRMRDGAFTSKIVVELSWISFLWVLWLATGGSTASFVSTSYFADGCGYSTGYWHTLCGQVLAFEAFAFLNWIILFGYSITILTFAINAATKGEPMWNSSVKELSWTGNETQAGAGIGFEKGSSIPLVADDQYGQYAPVNTGDPGGLTAAQYPNRQYPMV